MDQVGRYQILQELGRGAHGVVYKALDPAIGRTIAIKAINIGSTAAVDGERVREGILREARLAGTLSHPNIVMVYDVVDTEAAAYIVMEFVDGESLETAIAAAQDKRPGTLTRAGFLAIFRQVAQALDYAHRKGVIHRDVKPANIVLTGHRADQTGDLVAKIADFGVAKIATQEITRQLGSAPAIAGTPNYMSPEQAEGGSQLTGASDQFSLAVVAYEVLTGKKAFAADSLDALFHRIRTETEETVDTLNPALSPTVGKVMGHAMAKTPAERFQSCSEFAGALEFALGDSAQWVPGVVGIPAIAATPVYATTSLDQENSWGKRLLLLLALGLAVGVAIVMVVRMNSGSAVPTQVLDSRNAPTSPPPVSSPVVDDLKEDQRTQLPVPLPAAPQKTVVHKAPTKPEAALRPVKQIASSGEVQLMTDPIGANVVVDGVHSCFTPCSFTLAAGRHTLAATLPAFGVARKIFNVPGDLDVFIQLVKSVGVLLISSEPSGASLNVDGQAAGHTPLTLRLSPGTHRVAVWDGTRWHEESLQVTSDEVHTRLFRF